MLLTDLVAVSDQVARARARTDKLERLAALLRRLEPTEIEIAVCYLTGRLRQGKIGLGWSALRRARPPVGAPAPSLGLAEVDARFETIAGLSGRGSAAERDRLLAELLGRATNEEVDFLGRLVLGELRQGALAGLMAEALARAADLPAAEVRRALMLTGDLPTVACSALVEGRAGLSRFRLELFRPLEPMLAQPAEDLDAALSRLGAAALEYKLDGARVQVHKDGREVRVYSRRLNDVTSAVPELVETVRALPASRLLLDGEVLALRPDGRPRPFQVTMRRFGRKQNVEALRRELPLVPFFFDLLYLDGEDWIDRATDDRFAALRDCVGELVVPRRITDDPAAARAFLDGALRAGHEGLMAKATDAPYQAGGRGFSWLKVKPVHTLDLVVLAAEWGHGRRRGLLSNLHLGARAGGGGFVMLGKTFKGMTDAMLAWQTRRLQELAVAKDGHVVHVRPELVVEVAFSDVQRSPHYPAGMALRFARVRRYREDKVAAQADGVETLRAMLAAQEAAAEDS